MKSERLPDGWTWGRIASKSWHDPLDPAFAEERGGRWNPPRSFPTLYLNEDHVTARLNLRAFIHDWPFEPEDLRSDHGPVLVGATLPRQQTVCDAHTPTGICALGLPKTYPYTARKAPVPHHQCQPLGASVRDKGLRGVRTRSAQSRDGAGRELAWFPATSRSVATRIEILKYDAWYWA